ncbi:MAG: SpoIIE family protein phosphatase [Desulfuromonadaceae bacterium]
MKCPLRILHLEDDPGDAELVRETLAGEEVSCDVLVVAARDDFVAALEGGEVDLVLADFSLPAFDGMSALAIVREKHPDLPFVFVSGRLGEEAAIESLKNGATDYVLKSRLSRLVPAVNRALGECNERAERRKTQDELERAYQEIHERAESYQNLFTSIRDVIVVSDHDRRIMTANQPALREMFGYELDEVIGKSTGMLYADEEEYRITGSEINGIGESTKGKILEVNFRRKNGELFIGELHALKHLDKMGVPTGNIGLIRDVSERKKAEEALRESEMRRYQLQVELVYAAEIQAKLLPRGYPHVPGFDIAAHCLPAKQVGGDFFDWQEVCLGVWALTLGDVMGKGMAAAMLMATVRASMRSVGHTRPSEALRLVESAVLTDLENSESFVTLFLGQLNVAERILTFVDCGHGYVFLRRRNGTVEELTPRGLPLGVLGGNAYQEGTVRLEKGDTLVIYSDGLIDARPELALNNRLLAGRLAGAANAREMVGSLMAHTEQHEQLPDDVTVLVAHCME